MRAQRAKLGLNQFRLDSLIDHRFAPPQNQLLAGQPVAVSPPRLPTPVPAGDTQLSSFFG